MHFAGAGCSSGLKLELAPKSVSGYVGVFVSGSKWQAVIRVDRDGIGKEERLTVGNFDTAERRQRCNVRSLFLEL